MPELLKSQKAELFEIIKQNGFPPAAFELVFARGDQGQVTGNIVRYKGSNYSFSVQLASPRGFSVYYQPGSERFNESELEPAFPQVCYDFARWLAYLDREITAPDPWTTMSDYSTLVEVAPATQAPNTPFSFSELEGIWKAMGAIQATLLAHEESAGDQQKLITSQIEFLIESSKRMGRKDWLLLAIGSLVTICSAMSLSPDVARQIFHQLRDAVGGIIQLVPMIA